VASEKQIDARENNRLLNDRFAEHSDADLFRMLRLKTEFLKGLAAGLANDRTSGTLIAHVCDTESIINSLRLRMLVE